MKPRKIRNKRGRPRTTQVREASGAASRAHQKRQNLNFARWQRRALWGAVPDSRILDPLCGTPMGVLLLTDEQIAAEHYDASERYRKVVRQYARAMGLPNVDPPPHNLDGIPNGRDMDRFDETHEREITSRYQAVCAALEARGQPVHRVTYRVAVQQRMPDAHEMADLHKGLEALVLHFANRKVVTMERA